ncbi:MAG: hypothetical protein ACRCS9_08630 [Hyphomicrobium sp.]
MSKSRMSLKTIAAAAVVLAAASLPATAAPQLSLTPLKTIAAEQSVVEKTHGWHRVCRRGLNGVHKHIAGVGRIQCSTRRCWTNKFGIKRCNYF